MYFRKTAALIAITLCAALSTVASANTPDFSKTTLTGNWDGDRQRLYDSGIEIGGDFIDDLAANVSGGDRRTWASAYQLDFHADLDFQKLWGWRSGSLHVMIVNRGGQSLDAKANLGTLMSTQEIYGGHVLHLINFYLEQDLDEGKFNIKVGRFSFGNQFFQYPGIFQSLTFSGPEPAFLSPNDINNGAYSQVGAVFRVKPTKAWYITVAGFKVNPNNRRRKRGLFFLAPGTDTGTLFVAETGVDTNITFGKTDHDLPGVWKVGGWHSTADHPNLFLAVNGLPLVLTTAAPVIENSNGGVYAVVQQQLTHNAAGGGLTVVADYLHATASVYPVNQVASIQLSYRGLISGRPDDMLQFAVGRVGVSSQVAKSVRVLNEAGDSPKPVPGAEYDTEINYVAHVWHGLTLMPNIQYVHRPGGTPANHDALVLGLELNAAF